MNKFVNRFTEEEVKQLASMGKNYIKVGAPTLLRWPSVEELGEELTTYVSDGNGGARKESTRVVNSTDIIARQMEPIPGTAIFNEWAIPWNTVVKNYGQAVAEQIIKEPLPFFKKSTVQAVQLVEDAAIEVSWSAEPMLAKAGDWICTGGYSISQEDFKQYQQV